MMKKIILALFLTLLFVGAADAQKKKKKDEKAPKDSVALQTKIPQPSVESATSTTSPSADQSRRDILQKIYALGYHYYDLEASQMALYEMIAMDLSNIALRDSLALLYYNMGKYGSAIAVATDVLGVEKNNLAMLEIRGLSNESLQMFSDAVKDYEKLYLLSPNVYTLYKIAGLQYSMKRYEEAKTNIDIILNDAQSDSVKVPVAINQVQQQEVVLKAAALNLKGMVNGDLGNKAIAQQAFNEALKLEPQFQAAKNNSQELTKAPAKPKR